MRDKMSKYIFNLVLLLKDKIKKIDPVIIFVIVFGYFDFGIVQSVAIIIYIIYKIISSNNSNFYDKVTFS